MTLNGTRFRRTRACATTPASTNRCVTAGRSTCIPVAALVCMLIASAHWAHAETGLGPFGPEIQGGPEVPRYGISNECEADANGVTVRLIEVHDENGPEDYEYRQLVSRTDTNDNLLEEPFPFASDPYRSLPWGVACDGNGGFAVVWNVDNVPCLHVRTFDGTGAATSDDETLGTGCTSRDERPVDFDYSPDHGYRVLWLSRLYSDVRKRRELLFRTLDDDPAEWTSPVLLKRVGPRNNQGRWDFGARMERDDAVLIVQLRRSKVKGQIVGTDGSPITEPFRINLTPGSPASLDGIEDPGDGTMMPRWMSYWQAGSIGRQVAVSIPAPDVPSTTTTTMPDDPNLPLFGPASEPQRLRDSDGRQWAYPPTVAAAPDGTAVAVWAHIDGNNALTMSWARRRVSTGRWGARREFLQTKSVERSYRPRIVTDGNGNWLAMWGQSMENGCGFAATTSSDGRSWSPSTIVAGPAYPGTTNSGACRTLDFQLAADPEGAWLLVWADRIGTDSEPSPVLRISRSLNGGATWSPPTTLAHLDTDPWENVSLAASGDGRWMVTWATNFATYYWDRVETGGQVLFSRSEDSGASWTLPAVIAGDPGQSSGQPEVFGPRVAADRAGTWLVTWASRDDGSGGAGDWDIFASRSTDFGTLWSTPARVNAYAAVDQAQDFSPSLATDGSGRWMVAWETSQDIPGAGGLDYDIAVAASDDAGATWTSPVAVDRDADTDKRIDGSVSLANAGPGLWFAAWTSRSDVPRTFGIAVRAASLVEP